MNLEDEPHRVKIGAGLVCLSRRKMDVGTHRSMGRRTPPHTGDGRSLWELKVVQSRRDRRVGTASLWFSGHH